MKKASFLAIYAKDYQPWLNVKNIPLEHRQTKVNVLLMLNRWDGLTGFPGGLIDPGEDSKEAMKREVFEEIGYKVDLNKIDNNLLSDRTIDNNLEMTLYSLEVSPTELFDIQKNMYSAKDYGSEIMGSNIVILTELNNGNCFGNFKQTPMPKFVLEDIELLRFSLGE